MGAGPHRRGIRAVGSSQRLRRMSYKFPRSSGILLHAGSLPARFGIGDFGPAAYNFADFVAGAGQTLWQVLPLSPTGYGDSPYQCFSAFAGNPLFVSPEELEKEGLLCSDDLKNYPQLASDKIDYVRVNELKPALLRKAYLNFQRGGAGQEGFCAFKSSHKHWL